MSEGASMTPHAIESGGGIVTLEITVGKQEYQYRQNTDQPRLIEKRLNRKGARWKRFQIYTTPENATKALLSLVSENDDDE